MAKKSAAKADATKKPAKKSSPTKTVKNVVGAKTMKADKSC